jgi:hypothetical protein
MIDVTITAWAKDFLRAAHTAQELGRLPSLDDPFLKTMRAANADLIESEAQMARWRRKIARFQC